MIMKQKHWTVRMWTEWNWHTLHWTPSICYLYVSLARTFKRITFPHFEIDAKTPNVLLIRGFLVVAMKSTVLWDVTSCKSGRCSAWDSAASWWFVWLTLSTVKIEALHFSETWMNCRTGPKEIALFSFVCTVHCLDDQFTASLELGPCKSRPWAPRNAFLR